MKKNVFGFLAKSCITALFVILSCFAAVRSADAQIAAIILQNSGTDLQKASQHLLTGQQRANGFLGQIDTCSPCGVGGSGDGRAFWVNYIGKQNSLGFSGAEQTNLNTDFDLDSDGVQVGADLYRSRRQQFGVLFDYTGSVTKSGGFDLLRSHDFRGGAYYAHVFADRSDFRALATFGGANHRQVGQRHKIDSDSFNATFEYGKRFFPVQNVSWRPYIGLDVNYAYVGGDRVANIDFHGVKLSQTYLRIGMDLVTQIRRFTVRADLSYSVDMNSDRLKVSTYDEEKGWLNDRLDIGRQFVSVGVTGQYDLNRGRALFAGFGVDAFFDRDSRPYQSTGTVGYSFVW